MTKNRGRKTAARSSRRSHKAPRGKSVGIIETRLCSRVTGRQWDLGGGEISMKEWHARKRALTIGVAAVLLLGGCVPRATLQRMEDQLNYLESANRRNEEKIERLDSLLTINTESNREMRADVYTALDELKRELSATNQSISDLGDKIDRRGTEYAVPYHPEGDSGGIAQGDGGDQLLTVDCGKVYDQAFNDLRNGNYDLAIEGFEEFLNSCATSPDIPRALYWLGECHYSNDDFASAIEVFQQLIDQYAESDQVPGALFKLGRCYEKSDQPRHAIEYYNRLIEKYPDAPYVQPAQGRLEDLSEEYGD